MTTVTAVVHPGWVEVTSGTVHALVEAGERHAEALRDAAGAGMPGLLDALARHGLAGMPAFVAVEVADEAVRVVVRGRARARLADGRLLGEASRDPWSDTDLSRAEVGAEVVLLAPDPAPARGWRRPALLGRAVVAPPEPASEEALEEESDPEPEPDREPDVVAAEPEAEAEPEVEPEVAVQPAPPAPQPDLTLPPPDDHAGLPPVARVPAVPPPSSAVIDSVPWRRSGGPATTEALPAPQPSPPTSAPAPSPPVPGARVPDEQAPPSPSTPAPALTAPASDPGDHTASAPLSDDDSKDAAPEVTTARGALPVEADLDRPVVLAVLCPAGHHSPPHAGHCRSCGREIPPQQPFQTARPPLGVLRISTGGVVPLDRGVLLGRAPRVNEELPANQRPHLIRVGGADRDISRNHAEVLLEGWHVLVRDLGSTNGTTVALPGEEAVRLRPTEDQGIEPGTVITLADEVSLTYEVEE